MCETSKIPAWSRTARCSSWMPAYCTGISQPANGTSFAPGGDMPVVQRGPLERLCANGHGARTLARVVRCAYRNYSAPPSVGRIDAQGRCVGGGDDRRTAGSFRPPPRAAGTYDVVACKAPGAENRSTAPGRSRPTTAPARRHRSPLPSRARLRSRPVRRRSAFRSRRRSEPPRSRSTTAPASAHRPRGHDRSGRPRAARKLSCSSSSRSSQVNPSCPRMALSARSASAR